MTAIVENLKFQIFAIKKSSSFYLISLPCLHGRLLDIVLLVKVLLDEIDPVVELAGTVVRVHVGVLEQLDGRVSTHTVLGANGLAISQRAIHLSNSHVLDGRRQRLPVGRHVLAVSAPGGKDCTLETEQKRKNERKQRPHHRASDVRAADLHLTKAVPELSTSALAKRGERGRGRVSKESRGEILRGEWPNAYPQ